MELNGQSFYWFLWDTMRIHKQMRQRCWKGQSFSRLSTGLQANEATKHDYWLSVGARGCYPKTFHGSKQL